MMLSLDPNRMSMFGLNIADAWFVLTVLVDTVSAAWMPYRAIVPIELDII